MSAADTRVQRIAKRLTATFTPQACLVEDESALHAGHAGAASGGGHYRVRLVSDLFEGKNRLNRHRLVYDCLSDLMQQGDPRAGHSGILAVRGNELRPRTKTDACLSSPCVFLRFIHSFLF
jgi:BolA protein